MGRDAEQLPPLSSRKRDGPGQASGSYARTSPPSQNEGWGYEHDIETINRNASARRGTYRDNERLEPSYRNTSNDVWYTKPRGRGHEDNRAQVYQDDPWPHTGKAMDHYDGPYDDREASSGSPSDYDDRAHNRDHDWTPRREWFQNASESPASSIKEQEPGLEDSGGVTEDVWGVRETPQWPASEDQFREPEEDEIVLDELTRYWATPEHADVLRSNNKRSNKAFSENPVVSRRHKDSWGAAPQPAMTYHCEGYTSDVLIEQSKREFWSKRNGEWFLLNELTDTRFSRQQQQQQEQEELQQQLQQRQRRWQGQPQGSRSAFYKRSHITSHDDDEFTPEPFDHARAGFVTYEEWRTPRVNKGDPSEDEGSTQYNTDYEERRTPVDIEITDSGMRAPIEDGFDIEEVPPKDELTEDEASTSVPQSPTGAFGTLVDFGVQESEPEPESESRTGTETPTLTVPKQGLTVESKDRQNNAASCNVGLLVDLASEEPLIPIDNTPSTVFGALSAAELFSMFSSPQEQEQRQGFSKGNQLEDHPRLKETQSEKRVYDNIFDLIPSNLVSAPPETAMSPTPTGTIVPTGSVGSSLFDFVDPHDWLSQLARKNMEQFQESQANHKKEWTELMEKQQQDSRKIQEFIDRSNPPKPVPRAKKSRIPVSLSIVVETKDFGRQELRVREEEDLKVLVEDFCQTYNMHSYEMALWVTVASAIKKHKKMLRRDGRQSAVPTLI
ncbi:hypothetical protein BGX34_009004 [Mortierella sp. NVP85]|nr:hypothetical protein BGX34_009004 [Mortierella sp. NVP85]